MTNTPRPRRKIVGGIRDIEAECYALLLTNEARCIADREDMTGLSTRRTPYEGRQKKRNTEVMALLSSHFHAVLPIASGTLNPRAMHCVL